LGVYYHDIGDSKKEKFHYEAAAMAGNEVARFNLGCTEKQSGNLERAVKHCMIAASSGHHTSMHNLRTLLQQGLISRDTMDLTLTAYNKSCAEMRSEARRRFHAEEYFY
jgi:TPR repeat protein